MGTKCQPRGETLATFEFVVVGRYRDVEQLFAEQEPSEQIRLRVAHYLSPPLLLAQSNLVAFLPQSLVKPLGLFNRYHAFSIPTVERNFSISAVRHRRGAKDPGAQWFWERAVESVRAIHP